jgi:hypothetical protein
MSKVVLNMYVNGEKKVPLQLDLVSDNAHSILRAIGDKVTHLKVDGTLKTNMILDKVVVTPKSVEIPKPEPGFFDYFKSEPISESISEPVDLVKLSTMVDPDKLKNLLVEPTIDVYFKTPVGGRRRKTRKSRKSRRR